jgi:hypothetical protein
MSTGVGYVDVWSGEFNKITPQHSAKQALRFMYMADARPQTQGRHNPLAWLRMDSFGLEVGAKYDNSRFSTDMQLFGTAGELRCECPGNLRSRAAFLLQTSPRRPWPQ